LLAYKFLAHSSDQVKSEIINLEKDILNKINSAEMLLQKALKLHPTKEYEEFKKELEIVKEKELEFVETFKDVVHKKKKDNIEELIGELKAMDGNISKLNKQLSILTQKVVDKVDEKEKSVLNSVIVIVIISIIVSVILGLLSIKAVISGVNKLRDEITYIANNRDLTKNVSTDLPKELAIIAEGINALIEELKKLIAKAKEGAIENASVSHELSTTAYQVGMNVENSVGIVEETTNFSEKIVDDIQKFVNEAIETRREIKKAVENLLNAKEEIVKMADNVKLSADAGMELANKIRQLSQEASDVKRILDVISDIADQTNLLALNAAIEAARAGEHGRGFAVVADEVRKLAEKTQKSLQEINATINIIVQSINAISEQMDKDSAHIQELALNSGDVEHSILDSSKQVEKVAELTHLSIDNFEKTSNSVKKIVEKIKKINEISSNNARSVEEIASASEYLNNLAQEVSKELEIFRV